MILVTTIIMKKITSVGLLGIALALNLTGVAEAKEPQGCKSVVLTLPNGSQHKYVDCSPLPEPLPPAMVEELKRLMKPKPLPKPRPNPFPGSRLNPLLETQLNSGQVPGSNYLRSGVR
jgi:hypothetical protein